MNLWVNRVRQLAFLSVALFFFACEDETSFLGFKNPNDKFDNYSVEIPLGSSVIWLDSVRTSNFFVPGEVNRLLVGRYFDPIFGSVSSTAVTQYFWNTSGKIPTDAVFESAELRMAFDLYFYGSETAAEQTFLIYKIEDDLFDTPRRKYVSKTPVTLGEQVGSLTRVVNPELIRDQYTDPPGEEKAQPDTLKIPLNASFSEPLWNAAVAWAATNDSAYVKPDVFLENFKGLAIAPGEQNSMLIGLNPGSFSEIVLYYTSNNTKGKLTFSVNANVISPMSYNHIVPDYTGTPLEGISYGADFEPGNGLRYFQAGTGIGTKIDMSNFLHFADTVGPNMIINEVRVIVDGIEPYAAELTPPAGFILRGLTPDNTIRKLPQLLTENSADNLLFGAFRRTITVDLEYQTLNFFTVVNSDYGTVVANDGQTAAIFSYNDTNKRYSTSTPTSLFFQQLYRNRDNPVWTSLLMFPSGASASGTSGLKAVNRAVFPADQIKLKVKYTKATLAE